MLNICPGDEIGNHVRLKIECRKAWEFKSPPGHLKKEVSQDKKLQAYIIGLALGDGNLSNPNGRAVRLRITCDKKYPKLYDYIFKKIQELLPNNKVSIVDRKTCIDISCYSNKWEDILGWKAKEGSKIKQKIIIPEWIKEDVVYIKECLRGLFQTDGSIYKDREYLMVNFTGANKFLVEDVALIMEKINFPTIVRRVVFKDKTKYVIRLSKDTDKFIKIISLWKE